MTHRFRSGDRLRWKHKGLVYRYHILSREHFGYRVKMTNPAGKTYFLELYKEDVDYRLEYDVPEEPAVTKMPKPRRALDL